MKKAIGILLVCLLVLSAFFLGRSLGSAETAPEDGLSKRNLRLSATTDRNEPDKVIPLAQGNFPEAHYWSVKDVTSSWTAPVCRWRMPSARGWLLWTM